MPLPPLCDAASTAGTRPSSVLGCQGRERRPFVHADRAGDALEIALEHEREELDSIYRRAEA